MKVGSLVECINDYFPNFKYMGVICPELKVIYTIRNIQNRKHGIAVLLEEIKNELNRSTNNEYGFNINRFKEIQPPMDISELIKESIKEPA